jgi:hypothetical protein
MVRREVKIPFTIIPDRIKEVMETSPFLRAMK